MPNPGPLPVATPISADPLGHGYDNIRQLAEAIAGRLEREHHIMRNSGHTDKEGLHKTGSALAFLQATVPVARDGRSLGTDDKGLLLIVPSGTDNFIIKVYDGSKWLTYNTVLDFKTDTVAESTAGAGVTIDGLLLKDRNIENLAKVEADTSVKVGASVMYPEYVTAKSFRFGAAPASPQNGDMWMA